MPILPRSQPRPPGVIVDELDDAGIHYQLERVCCGKYRCGTCGGIRFVHGPYWYAYWLDARGTPRSRYCGRVRWSPAELGITTG